MYHNMNQTTHELCGNCLRLKVIVKQSKALKQKEVQTIIEIFNSEQMTSEVLHIHDLLGSYM